MKSLITLILLSVTFLFFTAGCSIPKISFLDKFKRADSQQAPADEAGEAGEADTFDVLFAPPQSAQLYSFNVPEKSIEPVLRFTGIVAPGCKVFINEKEFFSDLNGNFNAEVNLEQGSNQLNIKVVSFDGKSIFTTSKKVAYDPLPKLEVKQPDNISGKLLKITGSTDPHCIVDVNGHKTRADGSGAFTVTIPTSAGYNVIKVVSTNQAGKSATVQKTIIETNVVQ